MLAAIAVASPTASGVDFTTPQLIQFIESPTQIRAMIVECIWPRHATGRTDTNWVALSWQTNAYILRNSKVRVGLYDKFDTNKDYLITVRAGDIYSSVSTYKRLGVHIEQVVGSTGFLNSATNVNNFQQEIVTPKIRAQEELVSHILMVGIPVPIGGISITGESFVWRDNGLGRTVSGIIQVNGGNLVREVLMTNTLDRTAERTQAVIPMSVKYAYNSELGDSWFPSEVTRMATVNGTNITICRLIVHQLEFGVNPIGEFYPERFLDTPSANRVFTSNGTSYVTMKGITKAVLSPSDPRATGIQSEDPAKAYKYRLAFRIIFIVLTLLPFALFLQYRKNSNHQKK